MNDFFIPGRGCLENFLHSPSDASFYLHFQTVEDVYREFVQTIYTQVSQILTEAEERGQEHQ